MKSKEKPMYDFEYHAKVTSTNLLKVGTHDKVRQAQAKLQNALRANNAKIAKFLSKNNRPMDKKMIDELQSTVVFLEAELAQLMSGSIALYANKKVLKGIIPSGLQLSLFDSPVMLEAGTEEAKEHKGGIANAQ